MPSSTRVEIGYNRNMTQATITLTGAGIHTPQQPITIDVHSASDAVHAHVEINARAAKRKATIWLVSEVGNMLMAGNPVLVIGENAVWRMPVLLSSSLTGFVGQVGTVDVDSQSGLLLVNDALAEQILQNVANI